MVDVQESPTNGSEVTNYTGRFLFYFAMTIMAPFVEEILYRGLLLDAFTDFLGILNACFFSAVIFCFQHPVPLSAALCSVVYCFLAVRRKNLVPSIMAHFVINNAVFFLALAWA